MSINLERSIHPDLLEETLAEAEAQTTSAAPAASRRRRGPRSAPSPDASPPGGDQASEDGVEGDSGEGDTTSPESASPASAPPEWMAAVDAATDPLEKFVLLSKNLPTEELLKDSRLQGYIGNRINAGIREKLEQEAIQRQLAEQQRPYDQGDLYKLGQLSAAQMQQQREALEAQSRAAADPYMNQIRAWQAALPEEVQREIQGKNYDSFGAYLQAAHDARVRHGLEDEVRKRESGLRKSELSQSVGSEQTPELDGGPAQAYREITDAQVAAMSLEEYDRYFDDKGRPRPGVRVSLTRGIDVRREQSRR